MRSEWGGAPHQDAPDSLAAHLGLTDGSCVALVGAGGKTTTMLSLAQDLTSAGRTVLVTTTTRIWPPDPIPIVCSAHLPDVEEALAASFARSRMVALGRYIGPEGKLHGVDPARICELRSSGLMDVVLCEADGAAGRPAKAHREGEPVVPACTTCFLAISGVDAASRPVDDRTVHRIEQFCRVTGATPRQPLSPQHLATSLHAMLRYRPLAARGAILLNKVDDIERESIAREVVASLREWVPDLQIVMTSHGRVVDTVYRP